MNEIKDFFSFLSILKDLRLNVSIFVVSSVLLYMSENNLMVASDSWVHVFQSLSFITLIRIVYSVIGGISTRIQKQKEKKDTENSIAREKARLQVEREQEKLIIKHRINHLDVFQLRIIEYLRGRNSVACKKSAALFSLKRLGIVFSEAIQPATEWVSLTELAKEVLDEELWVDFDRIKHDALFLLFNNIEPEYWVEFKKFADKDCIDTTKKRSNIFLIGNSSRVFGSFSSSIVFLQPQIGNTYNICPIAKKVIREIMLP